MLNIKNYPRISRGYSKLSRGFGIKISPDIQGGLELICSTNDCERVRSKYENFTHFYLI